MAASPVKQPVEIYVVTDKAGTIRYVGFSWNARARQHSAWSGRFQFRESIQKWYVTLDQEPKVRVLAVVEWAERLSTETRLILRLRELGQADINIQSSNGDPVKYNRPDRCGTYAGYKVHKYHKEEPCQSCRNARNEYNRERYTDHGFKWYQSNR